jgi:hypothetical protein
MRIGWQRVIPRSCSSTAIRVQSFSGNVRDYCRTWSNQEEVTVRGRHFSQEDSPREIGQAIVSWLASIENRQLQATANS